MNRYLERFAAALAAVLIMTITFSATVSVPQQDAVRAPASVPIVVA